MPQILPLPVLLLAAVVTSQMTAGDPSATCVGVWESNGSTDVEILRHVHGTARGQSGLIEALAGSKHYVVTITRNADKIVVSFPGGPTNMLTTPAFSCRTDSETTIVNRGDWWTKHVASARCADPDSIELTATTHSGWWKVGAPDKGTPSATDYRRRLVLSGGPTQDECRLRMFLADEKGELEYLQLLHRVR